MGLALRSFSEGGCKYNSFFSNPKQNNFQLIKELSMCKTNAVRLTILASSLGLAGVKIRTTLLFPASVTGSLIQVLRISLKSGDLNASL